MALDHAAWNTDRSTSAQRIGGGDAVAASQRGSDQRQHLVPSVRPSRRAAEVKVMVDEFPQAQVPGESGRQEQAGIGHQAMVVKEDADTVGSVLWQHLLGAPCFRTGFCSKTIIPDSEEHPLASSRAVPKADLRWIRAKAEAEQAESEGRNHPGVPDDREQRNFTDPGSRIMPVPGGRDFQQSYNCQAVVDSVCQVIVAARATNVPSDKQQAVPMVEETIENTGAVLKELSADAGYYSARAVEELCTL